MHENAYQGTIPVHSMAHGQYTFPALMTVTLCQALGVPFYGQAPRCTKGGKRRRERASGRLVEGQACGAHASWVAVWVPHYGDKTLPLIYKPGVFLCDDHAKEKGRRDILEMIATAEAYEAYRLEVVRFRAWNEAQRAAEQARAAEQVALEHARREREILDREGRILRLSGTAGRLFVLADGTPECVLNDGRRVTPCCWREGARLIDNRIRGRAASGHSADCVHAHAEGD